MAKDRPACPRPANWLGLPLIATVARLLCRELLLQNEYLRLENKLLKSKIPGRLRFTDEERRSLVQAATALSRELMRQVVSIVKPETILKWQRRLEKQKWDFSCRRTRKPGRPRTQKELEALICMMARKNIWGYKRIQGELAKLGSQISKSCIADILRRNGLPPSPQRRGLSWREFLARHEDVLLCADLFTKEIWTFCGLRTAYVLFVVHLKTRTVLLAEASFSPHSRWMQQQIRNLLWECEERKITPRFLLHDRDGCFAPDFDAGIKHAGIRPIKTPFRAPNANAHAERWIRSIRQECLNHLILFGLKSIQRVLHQYKRFFNKHRPHQGIDNQVPGSLLHQDAAGERACSNDAIGPDQVRCEEHLGGLLKSYSREAA